MWEYSYIPSFPSSFLLFLPAICSSLTSPQPHIHIYVPPQHFLTLPVLLLCCCSLSHLHEPYVFISFSWYLLLSSSIRFAEIKTPKLFLSSWKDRNSSHLDISYWSAIHPYYKHRRLAFLAFLYMLPFFQQCECPCMTSFISVYRG